MKNLAIDYWRGNRSYVDRTQTVEQVQHDARERMWQRIFANFFNDTPTSALEVGAGAGQNLRAIKRVSGHIKSFVAVEPNAHAVPLLKQHATKIVDAQADDLSSFASASIDLVFTSGVLIHIPPTALLRSCLEINRVAAKYVVAIEYFSADPEMKLYRGEPNRLWKRDFGQFYLDNCPKLHPLACGFEWKGMTGLDNLTWWVFAK